MKAWHFITADRKLEYGDGRLVVDGETLTYLGEDPIKLYKRGMHFSLEALDALRYAEGAVACYVEVGPDYILGYDKGVSTSRKVIRSINATDIIVKFAIMQAIAVYEDPEFMLWAENWLKDIDRSLVSALAAESAARKIESAAQAAAYAAESAVQAAREVESAAQAAAYAALAAVRAARKMEAVAWAAVQAAAAAAWVAMPAEAVAAGSKKSLTQNQLLEKMLLEAMHIDKEGNPL